MKVLSATLLLLLLSVVLPSVLAAGEDDYHKVDLASWAAETPDHTSSYTHVEITGTVEYVHKEKDGDIHIRVCSDGYLLNQRVRECIIAECVPQLPCERPKKGVLVSVKGISRWDYRHMWWEIHPVISWRTEL